MSELNGKKISENQTENFLSNRWQSLCEQFLPEKFEDSIWRFNRSGKHQDSLQGWKLHISATILDACDLFDTVAPFLIDEDVLFKAPKSLDELIKINRGLEYGYHQVGKFITVYPFTEEQAVYLAEELDKLTSRFAAISIPFDEQYKVGSSVFYRYGAFANIEIIGENGKVIPAIRNKAGELVADDRQQAVPEWTLNPFPQNNQIEEKSFSSTPLGNTYKIFQAITQRGKGGTYLALDTSRKQPRLSIVKEGRRNGELFWNGQDGYFLVQNEFKVLKNLCKKNNVVPQVFESFEVHGNFYFTMEYVEGRNLNEILKPRRRRFSILQVLKLAVEIAGIIKEIHEAGWVWNDCKPGNLIVTNDKSLRPIDFEGSYPIGQADPFDWKTQGFSKSLRSSGSEADIFALGAVIYFLLTGRLFDENEVTQITKLRRNVPSRLIELTEILLSVTNSDIAEVKNELQNILAQYDS